MWDYSAHKIVWITLPFLHWSLVVIYQYCCCVWWWCSLVSLAPRWDGCDLQLGLILCQPSPVQQKKHNGNQQGKERQSFALGISPFKHTKKVHTNCNLTYTVIFQTVSPYVVSRCGRPLHLWHLCGSSKSHSMSVSLCRGGLHGGVAIWGHCRLV